MKLNNLSRLTALLLALTMFLSSVAWADPVAEGDYTADNYAEMLAAQTDTCAICVMENEFPTTDHNGNTISITCGYEYLENLGSPMERYHFLNYHYQQVNSAALSALYSVHTQHVEAGAENLWCNCAEYWSDFKEPGAENHKETCPWVDDTVVIIPNIPQPPVYGGDPQGNQYTSNEEYDLPMANDRAIILPEGGRAVIHSNVEAADGYQWQVYDGTQWVGIAGETGSDLVITTAKLNTIFELTGIAELRYFDKDSNIVLASVSVTSQEIAGGEYVDPVAETAQNLRLTEKADGDVVDENEWTITVHFVFANSTDPVANDWVGEFEANQPANYAVPLPTETGYYPTYNNVDISEQTTFDIALDTITGNIEYTIVYKPSNVKYTVKHYLQKVDAESGDKTEANYELAADGTVPHDGLTGQMISETLDEDEVLHKDYAGFRMIPYSTNFRVAADGSTVLEIYYDRDYYLMKFSLGDGGYGMEPIYDRYGADLTITTPTRPGYTFGGWDLATGQDADGNYVGDGTAETTMPTTMPAENRTYVALWTPVDTAKVTVVFWGETAKSTDENKEYAYYGSGTLEYDVGEEFTYADQTLDCATEAHTHTDACIACGKTEHQHTLENGCYTLNCDETSHNHTTDGCTLSCEHTSHELSCYELQYGDLEVTNEPTATLVHQGNNIYTYTTTGTYPWGGSYTQTHYYVKIGDAWYSGEYGDQTTISFSCSHTHSDSCYTCGKTESTHTHSVEAGCYDLICTQEVHTHTAECNGCGKPEHTHSDNCTITVSEMFPSNLWTRVESETKTVLPDGTTVVNVYYDRTEFTLTYKYNYRNGNPQTTETITAKWGANISAEYTKIAENADNTFWTEDDDGYTGPFTNYFETMPQNNKTYYCNGERGGSNGDMTYWGQDLNGDYTVKLFTVNNVGGYSVTIEDRYEFKGFTYDHGTAIGSDCGGATFYYTRNSYKLDFNNGLEVTKSETVLYEAPLSTYETYVPNAPSIYEAGSVQFAGWYLNPECTGAEYDLSAHTMPADNLILYAKWELVTHEVYFYEDEAAYDAGNKYIDEVVEVTHGKYADDKLTAEQRTEDYNKIDNIDALYKDGKYTFLGWFYKDGDVEKAFDPFDMPVKRDLHLYAKWSSDVLVDFDVNYVLESDPTVKVADSITGQALAATTETYEAKTGTDLYNSLQGNGVNYQSGYFPTVSSHSITFVIEETTEANNSYTFYYVPMQIVPYTVYYVTETPAEGDEDKYTQIALNGKTYYRLADTEVYSENTKSVVTEPYKPVAGYKPNAYQQKLILSVVWDETKNEFVPNDAANIIIFEYTPDPTSTTYYIQHYIGDGDGEWTLHTEEPRPGNYGDLRYAQPITIPGYTFDPDEPLTVREGTLVEGEKLILKLYYVQQEVEIKYEVVGPDGVDVSKTCTVSPTQETVKAIDGTATGSTAATSDNTFKFVGWYLDKACTKLVPDEWITDTDHITPQKTKDYDETLDGEKFGYEAATYYAKFEYNLTSMSIKKTGMSAGESAIFTVTNEEDSSDTWTVVVANNATVTLYGLTVGATYNIAEDGNWSWRYDATKISTKSITIDADPTKNEVEITNVKKNDYWVSDENGVINTYEETESTKTIVQTEIE